MALKKFWAAALIFAVMFLLSGNVSAMTFSQPVEIGSIGYHIGSPYHGYVVEGTSFNDGKTYSETNPYLKNKTSYIKGTAKWGNGEDALYCNYNYATNMNERYIRFGGKNSCNISAEWSYQIISKIDTDEGVTIYIIWTAESGTPHFKIIGRQKDDKWFSYIDSTENLSKVYFGGHEAYKSRDGVSYRLRDFKIERDTIIVPYINYSNKWGKIINEGEFRFKWDDAAQWFGVEHIVY